MSTGRPHFHWSAPTSPVKKIMSRVARTSLHDTRAIPSRKLHVRLRHLSAQSLSRSLCLSLFLSLSLSLPLFLCSLSIHFSVNGKSCCCVCNSVKQIIQHVCHSAMAGPHNSGNAAVPPARHETLQPRHSTRETDQSRKKARTFPS